MPGGTHSFCIGSETWPGLVKLAEECGELVQVLNKVIALQVDPELFQTLEHWDGTNLVERMEAEIGDLTAAVDFFVHKNPKLSTRAIRARHDIKYRLFQQWHDEANLHD